MRYVWIVLLALSLSTVVYGQKSAAVRQLEQQRKEALADIEETNKLLQETAQTAKTSLNRLNLLSKQILSRKKVISLLNQELDEIEKDILNIQGQLRTLKRELGDKQTNYGKSMRGLYKRHSSQDKLLFILSAESFSQSMRRMRYLREYADWQKRQANDIVEKQAEISRKQAEMEKTRAEKRTLLGTRQEESKKLESEEASQKEEVQLLNKRQKDLKADLQKKRRQAEALNRQIEKQIAEEIARAEAEAKAARERADAFIVQRNEVGKQQNERKFCHLGRLELTDAGDADPAVDAALRGHQQHDAQKQDGKHPQYPGEAMPAVIVHKGQRKHGGDAECGKNELLFDIKEAVAVVVIESIDIACGIETHKPYDQNGKQNDQKRNVEAARGIQKLFLFAHCRSGIRTQGDHRHRYHSFS